MQPTNTVKLPFWETVKRSFAYSLSNLDVFAKISCLWLLMIVYEAATDFPSLCTLSEAGCTGSLKEFVSGLIPGLAGISITVAFCRHIVLKQKFPMPAISFGLRELKVLGYLLLFALILILPSVVLIAGLAALLYLLNISQNFLILFSFVIPLGLCIYFSGLTLALPAIAVDNEAVRFKKAFEITKGNALRIFGGLFCVMFPFLLLVALISFTFGVIGIDTFVSKLVFSFLLLVFSFLGSFIRASYYAHMYQYFMYYESKRKTS